LGQERDTVEDASHDERVTVAIAAQRLGITKEAVRKRISRGTLRSDKDEDGTVRVYIPPSGTPSGTDRDELVAELRNRIAYLEHQVEVEQEARRRADTLLARLMDQLPELEPAQEASEHAESAAEPAAGASPTPTDISAQNANEQRPWWRRMFGG
jgi:hypothetical protein